MAKKNHQIIRQITASIRQEYAVLKDMAIRIDSHFTQVQDELTERELKLVQEFYAFMNGHQVALLAAIEKMIKITQMKKKGGNI